MGSTLLARGGFGAGNIWGGDGFQHILIVAYVVFIYISYIHIYIVKVAEVKFVALHCGLTVQTLSVCVLFCVFK